MDCKPAKLPKFKSPTYSAPQQTVKQGEKLTAVVKTSCGSVEIALNSKWNPKVVNSFVFLVEEGFYDGLPFDRAAEGTYLEAGKPSGGAETPGYLVAGRIPQGFVYRQGVVAMWQVKSYAYEPRPGSKAGSEFFFSLAKPWIDLYPVHAPFGTVKKGLPVLIAISELGPPGEPGPSNVGVIGRIGKLRRPVVIESIQIERS